MLWQTVFRPFILFKYPPIKDCYDRPFIHLSFITENSEERILTSFYATVWIFGIATWWWQSSHWTTLALQMVRSAIKTSKHIIPWKEVLLWWRLRTTYSKDTRSCRETEYIDSRRTHRWLSRDLSLSFNIQYQHCSWLLVQMALHQLMWYAFCPSYMHYENVYKNNDSSSRKLCFRIYERARCVSIHENLRLFK